MPKQILRITLESIEVPDDYVLQERNDPHENQLILESDDYTYIGTQNKNQLLTVAVDPFLRGLTPEMQFIYWSQVAWQSFYPAIPPKLQIFMNWFASKGSMAAVYAREMMMRTNSHQMELTTGQVRFKEWDAELFSYKPPKHMFSVN